MEKTHSNLGLEQLKKLAQSIAENLKPQDVLALSGDLGAGKTTFAQHLINYFFIHGVTVNSPTFNLVNLYNTHRFTIWHFDLYRLDSLAQVYELGIEDAFNDGVSIIEWPNIAENILPDNTIKITIKKNNSNDLRSISIQQCQTKYVI